MSEKYDLNRFIKAQNILYDIALAELINGKKLSHWMWFIFPQLKVLGYSYNAKYYGISNLDEAKCYIKHEVLGQRYIECCKALLNLEEDNIVKIMGYVDALKLKSSITLFKEADSENNKLYCDLLNKYYEGKACDITLNNLK